MHAQRRHKVALLPAVAMSGYDGQTRETASACGLRLEAALCTADESSSDSSREAAALARRPAQKLNRSRRVLSDHRCRHAGWKALGFDNGLTQGDAIGCALHPDCARRGA